MNGSDFVEAVSALNEKIENAVIQGGEKPTWYMAPLLNGSTGKIEYCKIGNVIYYEGNVKRITEGAPIPHNVIVGLLPVGYRPRVAAIGATSPSAVNLHTASVVTNISADGNIRLLYSTGGTTTSGAEFYISGSFIAAG